MQVQNQASVQKLKQCTPKHSPVKTQPKKEQQSVCAEKAMNVCVCMPTCARRVLGGGGGGGKGGRKCLIKYLLYNTQQCNLIHTMSFCPPLAESLSRNPADRPASQTRASRQATSLPLTLSQVLSEERQDHDQRVRRFGRSGCPGHNCGHYIGCPWPAADLQLGEVSRWWCCLCSAPGVRGTCKKRQCKVLGQDRRPYHSRCSCLPHCLREV